jgi:hypothetical protein
MRLRRAPAAPPPVVEYARANQARLYSDGIADGIEMTLRALLGESQNGAAPFDGDLPADVRRWARECLARVRIAR